MRQIGFCGSLLALVVGVSSAQRPTEQQIRAVADSFYAAINAERWADAAKLLDMDRFRVVFKQAQDNYRFRPIFAPPVTAEDLMASDSTMPRAVAEWQAASFNKSRSQAGNFLSYEYANVDSAKQLMALTPEEGASRWLEAKDMRYKMRLAWKQTGCPGPAPLSMAPELREQMIAVAIADDSTAFVVHSSVDQAFTGRQYAQFGRNAAPRFMDSPKLLTLFKKSGGWKIDSDQLAYGNEFGFAALGGPGCGNQQSPPRASRLAHSEMIGGLTLLRTAEEVFFTDSEHYSDKLSDLKSFQLPANVEVKSIVLSKDRQSYQITMTSKAEPGVSCAIAVGTLKNPIDDKAPEGAPICK